MRFLPRFTPLTSCTKNRRKTILKILIFLGFSLFREGLNLRHLTLAQRAEEHGVTLEFIKPGKPT